MRDIETSKFYRSDSHRPVLAGETRRDIDAPRVAAMPTPERYRGCDCPYCHGPLVVTPQCAGRTWAHSRDIGDGWHECTVECVPASCVAVACASCELAFFPLRAVEATHDA